MFYLIDLHIDNHKHWGQTISKDVVLPSKIRHIKSLFAYAQLGMRSFVIPQRFPVTFIDENGKSCFVSSPFKIPAYNPLICNLSVSVNSADLLMQDMPIYAQSKMQSSHKTIYFTLEKPYEVVAGSGIKLTVEEKQLNPFYNADLALYYEGVKEAFLNYQGFSAEDIAILSLTNEYTVKLFIEYD